MSIRRIVPATLAGKIVVCSVVAFTIFTAMVHAEDGYFVTGLVRDFRSDYPAMETTNPDREALNLGPVTAAGPTWSGNGQKIAKPWRDIAKNDIAPVLFDAALGDEAGSFAHPDNSGYTASSFAGLWTDTLGTNLSQTVPFKMVQQPSGAYEYSSNNFYPADGKLFGTKDFGGHNQYFTVEWHLSFTADSGQWLNFACDDEVFIYVNGVLVVDLAGKVASHAQLAMFDRLKLVEGQKYNVDIFYADRHKIGHSVKFTTNVRFDGLPLSVNFAGD